MKRRSQLLWTSIFLNGYGEGLHQFVFSNLHTRRQNSLKGIISVCRAMSAFDNPNNVGRNEDKGATLESYCQPLTPWREMIDVSIAKSRKIRGGNYVQISSFDPQTMEPRCRTLVFRGFQKLSDEESIDKSCTMKMITDARSQKVSELQSPYDVAEMVWWFAKSSEQYRIRGKVQFVGEGNNQARFLSKARKDQWGNLSDPAREQFFWNNPGDDFSGEPTVPAGGKDSSGKILPPPEEFLLMLLHPFKVDYLRLKDNYHQEDFLDTSDGTWKQKRVNP